MDDLRISALMCSKVCHDLISPVGALGNGIEVLNEDQDPEMREHAMALIEASAQQASAKLQFARLAYGASGSAGSEIDLREAENVLRNLMSGGKVSLNWRAPAETLDKDLVKLLANLVHMAGDTIPRGGEVTVDVMLTPEGGLFKIVSKGVKARFADEVRAAINGEIDIDALDARSIIPYVCGEIARRHGGGVQVEVGEDVVTITNRFQKAVQESAVA
ncbi:MAG: histidine phosphotransferase [Alphaproteobacteria bacterium]|nr:MAG: histidine phosphotransferase [Alphaproteobacteria bacterium]